MKRNRAEHVIDTMNTIERARAIRETTNALRLVRLADALASRVRRAANSAAHAMTLVYGRAH